MANKIEIGTRVLFVEHAGAQVKMATIKEYSPSGNYVGVRLAGGEPAWYPTNTFSVVEVLEIPKAPTPPVQQQQQQQQEAPPTNTGSAARTAEPTVPTNPGAENVAAN